MALLDYISNQVGMYLYWISLIFSTYELLVGTLNAQYTEFNKFLIIKIDDKYTYIKKSIVKFVYDKRHQLDYKSILTIPEIK